MAERFIIIKRKGSKRILGAIPIKKNTTLTKLKKFLPKGVKKGFVTKIITKTQLKTLISKLKPRGKTIKKRTIKKRKVMRKKKRVKRKRRK